MANAKKAKNYAYAAGENPFADRGNTGFLTTNIDLGFAKEPSVGENGEKFDGTKHEIYWFRPRVAEYADFDALSKECQEHWGEECDLQTMIDLAIGQLMVRPDYKNSYDDADDAETRQQKAQDLAMNYNVGRRASTAPGVKKKASAYDALQKQAEDLGLSLEEILAIAKAQKGAE